MRFFSSILDHNEWDVRVFAPSSTRILLGDFGTMFLALFPPRTFESNLITLYLSTTG